MWPDDQVFLWACSIGGRVMHLIDIGYKFNRCSIFVQTDTPGEARRFRELLYKKILGPANDNLAPDLYPPEPWEDPLEKKV